MKHVVKTLHRPADLVDAGLVAPEKLMGLEKVAARYAVAITPALAALIETSNDPIGRQFVPDLAELHTRAEELVDPIGDHTHSPTEGVVHRYPDRVLLKLTPLC